MHTVESTHFKQKRGHNSQHARNVDRGKRKKLQELREMKKTRKDQDIRGGVLTIQAKQLIMRVV